MSAPDFVESTDLGEGGWSSIFLACPIVTCLKAVINAIVFFNTNIDEAREIVIAL